MNISELIQESIKWLTWGGVTLLGLTLITFIFKWGIRFRLVGATIFTFLLAGSCLAFNSSYRPPQTIEGAKYAPIVYDNGYDLVIAQVSSDFPEDAVLPSLQQISKNLKGGGRNGAKVVVRIRKIESDENGVSTPIVLGEVIRDIKSGITREVLLVDN